LCRSSPRRRRVPADQPIVRYWEWLTALVAHGPAFAAWYSGADVDTGTPLDEQFEEAFCGEWESLGDYAEELATETGEATST